MRHQFTIICDLQLFERRSETVMMSEDEMEEN